MNGRLLIPAILLFAALILSTVFGERKNADPKRYLRCNLALTAVGLLLWIGSRIASHAAVSPEKLGEETAGWADDMLSLYAKIFDTAALVLLALTLFSALAALFDPKQRKPMPSRLRLLTSLAGSALILFTSPFYAYLSTNESVPLPAFILLAGIGQALLLRAVYVVEFALRLRGSVKKT